MAKNVYGSTLSASKHQHHTAKALLQAALRKHVWSKNGPPVAIRPREVPVINSCTPTPNNKSSRRYATNQASTKPRHKIVNKHTQLQRGYAARNGKNVHGGLKYAGRMWPARTFCAARDAFREFSNDYYLNYLVYSLVFNSARAESEKVPFDRT